jgi:hypothetical protein
MVPQAGNCAVRQTLPFLLVAPMAAVVLVPTMVAFLVSHAQHILLYNIPQVVQLL